VDWDGAYINLDRSIGRRRHIERELAKMGAHAARYRRFAAVDGAAMAPSATLVNSGELACYLSHVEAMRAHRESGRWLHVVEDDIVISPHAGGVIERITADPRFAVYDIIFTNNMFVSSPTQWGVLGRLFDSCVSLDECGAVTSVDEFHIIDLDGMHFSSMTSYLIGPRTLERVIALLSAYPRDNPFTPIDDVCLRYARSGSLKAGCVIPFLTVPTITRESLLRAIPDERLIQMTMEHAIFAGRDMAALHGGLEALAPAPEARPSITTAMLRRCVGMLIAPTSQV